MFGFSIYLVFPLFVSFAIIYCLVFYVVVVVVALPAGAGAEVIVCWVVVLLPREPKFHPVYKKSAWSDDDHQATNNEV